MDVTCLRLITDAHDHLWTFVLCRTPDLESETQQFAAWYDTAGEALDAAMKWCEDRKLTLNWCVPLDVINRGQVRQNVVEAAERFRPTDYRHPSRFTS